MIWLEEANEEAKPPPLEFCTNTINIKNIDAIRIKMVMNKYILFGFYVNNQFF